jgi:hypothetical protein
MVTYILMALAVAAVALLAGFTGGLPSPSQRPIENNGITPEPELESQAADAIVNMRLPKTSCPDRIITAMACAMVVLVGALGVVTFRLTTCGGDQPKLQGTVGSSLADGTMIGVLRSAQAMQAQADTSLHEEDHNAPATALVATAVISEPPKHPAHEMRVMSRSAIRIRSTGTPVAVSMTYSSRGTWLFPPDGNGGG